MKKLNLFIYLFLATGLLFAEEVPKEVAKKVALNFFYEQTNIPQSELKVQNEIVLADAKSEALIYAFNIGENNGFVLVTAEDNALPIIGYSTEGQFSNKNLPLAFADYLDFYKKQIREIKDSKLKANDEIKNEWDNYSKSFDHFEPAKSTKEDIQPLLGTIAWDQGAGWNAMAPLATDGPDGRAYAGCVATATGMIMKYHKHPEVGTGDHYYSHTTANGFDVELGKLSATYEGTSYDWSAMTNTNATAETAKLLYHIGVAVEMNFSAEGSGAQTSDAVHALKKYFDYSPKAVYVARSSYDDEVWKGMIINELEERRPILHSGYGEFGHAFVCDGLSGTGYFHFNWGWSGYANGYFTIDNLNPGGSTFNDDQSASFGLEPAGGNYNYTLVQQDALWLGQSRGLSMIKPVDENVAWAIPYDGSGDQATLLEFSKTVDGGANWKGQTLGITTGLSVSMISPLDADNAWLAVFKEGETGTAGIYKTTTGGDRWDYVPGMFTAPASFANVIHFFNNDEGFCQGDPVNGEFECYYTTDGGANWIPVSSGNLPNPLSTEEYGTVNLVSVVDDVAYFSTNKGRVFKSIDKGKTWTASQTPSSSIGEIEFSTVDYGIVNDTEAAGTYYVTEDGAQTWAKLEYTGKMYSGELSAVPGAPGVYFSSSARTGDSGASHSFDGGKTWTILPELYGVQSLAIGFTDIANGWIGAFNSSPTMGGFMKFTGNSTITNFESDETINCVDNVISVSDKSYSVNDILSYSWSFGEDASPQTATGIGPHDVSYTTAGKKTITLEVTDNLDNTFTYERENYIEIIDLPTVDFTYVIGGNTIDFTNISTQGLSYFWTFGDGRTSTDYHTRNVYGTNQTYSVSLEVSRGGCAVSTQQDIEMTTVSIEDFHSEIIESIYPNPVKDMLVIELNDFSSIDVSIIDISGKIIYYNNFSNSSKQLNINVQSLENGIYFIQLKNEDGRIVKRFVKE